MTWNFICTLIRGCWNFSLHTKLQVKQLILDQNTQNRCLGVEFLKINIKIEISVFQFEYLKFFENLKYSKNSRDPASSFSQCSKNGRTQGLVFLRVLVWSGPRKYAVISDRKSQYCGYRQVQTLKVSKRNFKFHRKIAKILTENLH